MGSIPKLANLGTLEPMILPSLLLCDFGNLQQEIERLEEAGVGGLHLDVMDGHFVPNLTYGMPIVAACRRISKLPIDVHLMIDEPERYLEDFRQAGADILTIHAEATDDPAPLLEKIHEIGAAAGLAFNPNTSVDQVAECLELCDLVLPMSVMPGFGGQQFEPTTLGKFSRLSEVVRPGTVIEADGGINTTTIADCAAHGARWFVVGSALLKSSDYSATVSRLVQLAGQQQLR